MTAAAEGFRGEADTLVMISVLQSVRNVPATLFMALICALPPTRDTEIPALIAGRTPEWNKSDCRYICPSVIEITFGGM